MLWEEIKTLPTKNKSYSICKLRVLGVKDGNGGEMVWEMSIYCLSFYTYVDLSKQGYQKQKTTKKQKESQPTSQQPSPMSWKRQRCHREGRPKCHTVTQYSSSLSWMWHRRAKHNNSTSAVLLSNGKYSIQKNTMKWDQMFPMLITW